MDHRIPRQIGCLIGVAAANNRVVITGHRCSGSVPPVDSPAIQRSWGVVLNPNDSGIAVVPFVVDDIGTIG